MTEGISETQESAAPEPADSAAALSARLLSEEALRTEQMAGFAITIADDQIPGVGADAMSLRQGLKVGGLFTFTTFGPGQFIEFGRPVGFSVLAPDIQKTLHVSDAVIAAIGGAFGILFLAGSIPWGRSPTRYAGTKAANVARSSEAADNRLEARHLETAMKMASDSRVASASRTNCRRTAPC
jgi:hypothetical protein